MHMIGVISGTVTPRDKTNSSSHVDQKIKSTTKSALNFQLSPVTLSGGFAPKQVTTLKHGIKINKNNKSENLNNKFDLEV